MRANELFWSTDKDSNVVQACISPICCYFSPRTRRCTYLCRSCCITCSFRLVGGTPWLLFHINLSVSPTIAGYSAALHRAVACRGRPSANERKAQGGHIHLPLPLLALQLYSDEEQTGRCILAAIHFMHILMPTEYI